MSENERKRVMITGANAGIGHQMTAALLGDGFRVAAVDIDTDALGALTDEYPDRLRVYDTDVTDLEEVRATVADVVDAWGGIDILVNNAAVFDFCRCEELSVEDVGRAMDVNFVGYVRMVQAVLPEMRAAGGGIVHNVSSGVGCFGHPGLSSYAATKGAIEAWTRSLQMELADEPIDCTLMHPPLTNTDTAAGLQMGYPDWAMGDPQQVGQKLAANIESTRSVIAADWTTRVTLLVARWFPSLVRFATARTVQLD